MLSHAQITRLAAAEGFACSGVVRVRELDEQAPRLARWLAEGRNGALGYMARHRELRIDPQLHLQGAKSLIACALAYSSPESRERSRLAWERDGIPRRAAFTDPGDYHIIIRRKLLSILRALRQTHPALRGQARVDSAPLLEKAWASEAGIGWVGRNSLIINPKIGSFILLGELIVDMEADRYDAPFAGERCGGCRRCVEACPVGAIGADRTIDASRCIAALSVERERLTRSAAAEVFPGGWIYGCDACQEACPYN